MRKTITILFALIFSSAGGLMFSGCTTVKKSRLIVPPPSYMAKPVMSPGIANPTAMIKLFRRGNPKYSTAKINQLVACYIQEAKVEGVNVDLAFCQMCLETRYLLYGGQVKSWQHNFCGLGAVDGGAKGAHFKTAREGVRAHIQHLKAYGSHAPLSNRCIDPRFMLVKRGTGPTVASLAGRWASDKKYGHKLSYMLRRLHTY